MNRPYQIWYDGRLAECKMTCSKAKQRALELVLHKGWDKAKIQVIEAQTDKGFK